MWGRTLAMTDSQTRDQDVTTQASCGPAPPQFSYVCEVTFLPLTDGSKRQNAQSNQVARRLVGISIRYARKAFHNGDTTQAK
jgi:hypothetical protein